MTLCEVAKLLTEHDFAVYRDSGGCMYTVAVQGILPNGSVQVELIDGDNSKHNVKIVSPEELTYS